MFINKNMLFTLLLLLPAACPAASEADIQLVESYRLYRTAAAAIMAMESRMAEDVSRSLGVSEEFAWEYPPEWFAEVSGQLERAIELNPHEPHFHVSYANLFWGTEDHVDKTIKHFRLAYHLNRHDDSIASAFVAAIAQSQEGFEEAVTVVEWLRLTKSEFYQGAQQELDQARSIQTGQNPTSETVP